MCVTGMWLLHTCASSQTAMQHDVCVYLYRGHLLTRKSQVLPIPGSWQPLHMILSVAFLVNIIFNIVHDFAFSSNVPL